MGAILDSAQDIRHRQKGPPRQAHRREKKLEKKQDPGVNNMTLERTYTIPLRKEWLKTPLYKRAKKAVAAVRQFTAKHMKTQTVLIGPKLNLKIWERGIKNPPCRVKVTCWKDEKEDVTRVELFGFKFEKKEKKEKEKKPKGLAGKLQEKLGPKEEEKPKEKVTTKKDIKELKKGVEVKKEAPAEEMKEAPKKEDSTPKPAVKKE